MNSCCKPNAKYNRDNNVLECVTVSPIRAGQEITVLYDTHYFDLFNKSCLCPHTDKHVGPFESGLQFPIRKKRPKPAQPLVFKSDRNHDCQDPRYRYRPSTMGMDDESVNQSLGDGTPNLEMLSYDSIFSDIEKRKGSNDILRCTLSEESRETESFTPLLPNVLNSTPVPVIASTPLRLTDFEDVATSVFSENINFVNLNDDSDDEIQLEEDNEILDDELYHESAIKTESFHELISNFCDNHKISDKAHKDLLKILSSVLPQPNNVFGIRKMMHLPLVVPVLEKKGTSF